LWQHHESQKGEFLAPYAQCCILQQETQHVAIIIKATCDNGQHFLSNQTKFVSSPCVHKDNKKSVRPTATQAKKLCRKRKQTEKYVSSYVHNNSNAIMLCMPTFNLSNT